MQAGYIIKLKFELFLLRYTTYKVISNTKYIIFLINLKVIQVMQKFLNNALLPISCLLYC